MFSRKKKEKKKHKPGMTEAELSKLEEAGIRRGFFSVRKSSKHESHNKTENPAPKPEFEVRREQIMQSHPGRYQAEMRADTPYDITGEEEEQINRSVLQKAANFGNVVMKNKGYPASPVYSKPRQEPAMPVPPQRLKSVQKLRQVASPGSNTLNEKLSDFRPMSMQRSKPLNNLSNSRSVAGDNSMNISTPMRIHPPAAAEKGYSVPTPWASSLSSPESQFEVDMDRYSYQRTVHDARTPMGSTLAVPPSTKKVLLHKRKSGDFGISLRRSSVVEQSPSGVHKKTIYFVEPGSSMQNSGESLLLSPGDRLVAVEGRNVEDVSRDDIVNMIKTAKDTVTLTVQTIPEDEEANLTMISNWSQEHMNTAPIKQDNFSSDIRRMDVTAKDDGSPKVPIPKVVPGEKNRKNKEEPQKNGTPRQQSNSVPADNSADLPTNNESGSLNEVNRKVVSDSVEGNNHRDDSLNDGSVSQVAPNELHANTMIPDKTVDRMTKDITKQVLDENHNKKIRKQSQSKKTSNDPEIHVENTECIGSNNVKSLAKSLEGNQTNTDISVIESTPVKSQNVVDNDKLMDRKNMTNDITDCTLVPFESQAQVTDNNKPCAIEPNCDVSCEEVSLDDIPKETEKSLASPPAEIVFTESEWEESDRVWFCNDDNFSAANLLAYTGEPGTSKLEEGKARIKLELSKEILTVDEEKIQKANPTEYDRAEDISGLRYLNKSSMVNTLQQRYNGNLLHTYAGPHLVSFCPLHQSSSYTDKVMQMFKGCRKSDMPPHIFSSAQIAYHQMMNTGNDQSLVLTGCSGSGKSQNVRNVLRYLTNVSGTISGQVTGEKMNAVSTILESFCNATTQRCNSSSRCVHLFDLNFNKSGQIVSASVQYMLYEISRVVKKPEHEKNFHIFYQLAEGSDAQTSRELFLVEVEQQENPILYGSSESAETKTEGRKESLAMGFKHLKSALHALNFSADEVKGIFNVVAACLHLGLAGYQSVSGSRYQFLNPDAAQKASSLLGISVENLTRAVFQPSSTPSRTPASPSVTRGSTSSLQRTISASSVNQSDDPSQTGQDYLEAFIVGLYNEAFKLTVSLINRSLSSSNHTQTSLIVMDAPGLQSAGSSLENPVSGSLEDLIFNYLQERLQLMFHHTAFTTMKDRYKQENIEFEFESDEEQANAVVKVIDLPPPTHSHMGSNLITDKKGIFWLLDEEAMIPGASEESFIERLSLFFGKGTTSANNEPLVKKLPKKKHFSLRHLMGSSTVNYNTSNWLKLCRGNVVTVAEFLQSSKKKYISSSFGNQTNIGSAFQGSVVGLDSSRGLGLFRKASMRKTWNTSGTSLAVLKKKSLSMQKKLQVDNLMDALQRTQVHFVLCFALNYAPDGKEQTVHTPSVIHQLEGFQLLQAMRVYKQGYPEHVTYSEFRRRFEVICRRIGAIKEDQTSSSPEKSLLSENDQQATEYILQQSDIERSQYRLGVTQVLLRAGILNQLENARNEKLSSVIIGIQAHCRGLLARKYIEKRKVQVVAIRCIQRNVQKFLMVRQWPWWRLLTKVLPLVEVHRTEEDLKEREAELELLKSLHEKTVIERDELKQMNDKNVNQLNEIWAELAEERVTATRASDMLEQEILERMRLEKEVKELETINLNMGQRMEKMEMEIAEQRLLNATEHDSDSDEDDGEYKLRYDKLKREADFKYKKIEQENLATVEEMEADKKHIERKLHQLQEELEEQERLTSQHKRKAQRTTAELNDSRVHLEETNAKLHQVEKKQRKFDSELYALQSELTLTKSNKDRLQREKDQIAMELSDLNKLLDESNDEKSTLQIRCESLEQEMEDSMNKDTEDGQVLIKLKKEKRELENKSKDQEEELDEQAGQIQMLQQAKERLEMVGEQNRRQYVKDIEGKEEEIQEIRASYQKKVKHLEGQLEEAEDERSSIIKQKRELEQRLVQLQDTQPYAKRDAEAEKRLRKDLKRYKVLLADAQTMIDHLKSDAINKQQLKQLKSQLEEAQYTCANAVKSKKAIELELEDVQAQLEEISRAKQEGEVRVSQLQREIHELKSRMEEDADDSSEFARKYKSLVSQQCDTRKEIFEMSSVVDDLKREKEMLNEKILNLQSKLDFMQDNTTDKSNVLRLDNKVRDLETKLDFEKNSSRRLEVQLGRLKDQAEKLQSERDMQASSEHREREQCKRLQKQLREAKDDQTDMLKREQEAIQKQHELELDLMECKNQNESLQVDLKLAFKRISDLQIAFEDLEDSGAEAFSHSDDSDSDSDSEIGERPWRSRKFSRSLSDRRSLSTSSRASISHSLTSGEGDFSFSRVRRGSKASYQSEHDHDSPPSSPHELTDI